MSAPKDSQADTSFNISRKPDGLHYAATQLAFRITGLTPHNLDRLRITLRAQKHDKTHQTGEGLFHVDTLDLYYSRAREAFAECCVKYLRVKQADAMQELNELIKALEAERIAMRERGTEKKTPPMTEEERQEALSTLKSKDLLSRIVSDFDSLGFVGEKRNKILGYLAAVSRLLPRPLSLLMLSNAGVGKTSLQDAVCKFVPPESVIQYTRLSGQSLFYRQQDLQYKVLAIEEQEGAELAMYSIKTLISSQKLSVATTRTDAKTGKLSVDEYTVKGPVAVFVSSTRGDDLPDDFKRRFMVTTLDESHEQTQRIMQAQRLQRTPTYHKMHVEENTITRLHHTMQRLLKPLTVMVPENIKVRFPNGRMQMRGEQEKYFSLIEAMVLLHQYQRKTGTMKRADGGTFGYVQATQADVDLALELGRQAFISNLDDVTPMGRRLLREIVELVHDKQQQLKENDPNTKLELGSIPFTRKELRERLGWSEKQVRVTIDPLVELGYLGIVRGMRGSTYRYVLLDDGSNDPLLRFGEDHKKGYNQKSMS